MLRFIPYLENLLFLDDEKEESSFIVYSQILRTRANESILVIQTE